MKRILLLSLFALLLPLIAVAQESISEKTSGMEKYEGFFDYWWDEDTGKIWLEIDKLDQEFIYVNSMAAGVGSNDIGLDRSQLGNTRIVKFEKVGPKILMVQPNYDYRASSENRLEKKSIEEAFAESVLCGFEVAVEVGDRILIDLTEFLMQDAHGVSNTLSRNNQGNYSVNSSRSAIHLPGTFNFPENSEFETILTFTGSGAGGYLRSVTPSADAVTVRLHHSFVELPDAGYKPRELDPRSGFFGVSYQDYSTPIGEDMTKRYAVRHRLEKKDPGAELSEPVEPIVFYLDNGTPEPVRTALLEGGRWWNEAFEAIGYKDAFQLKMLPDDADPLDVRYNVIQWVHRSTRGWSYGSSITDPRTGEIIKGHVSLGSLRIRQDFLIAQALMDKPFAERDDNNQPMLNLAIARIRQLSAHEIGHTIGFAHNYAASTNDRASVMDYPHPQFSVNRGAIDFSNAYSTGIGDWDKVTVAYSYADFENGANEREELNKILKSAQDKGLRYITDQDARPQGSAHVLAHLWDNGTDVSKELEEMLKVRKTAIANFSIDNIRTNEPNSVLEDVFVPLYFFHRYQTEGVTKIIGGMEYNYAVKGDGQDVVTTVDRKTQENALEAVLQTLDAEEIAIPKEKLNLFPPRAFGYGRTRESINGKTGVSFDALSAAETAADMTLGFLLHPERASRLIQQKYLDGNNLGLQEVLNSVVSNTLNKNQKDDYLNGVKQNINFRVLFHIMNLAVSDKVHPQVNALANQQLSQLASSLGSSSNAINLEMARRIKDFYAHPDKFEVIPAPVLPDGSPIGTDCFH